MLGGLGWRRYFEGDD